MQKKKNDKFLLKVLLQLGGELALDKKDKNVVIACLAWEGDFSPFKEKIDS